MAKGLVAYCRADRRQADGNGTATYKRQGRRWREMGLKRGGQSQRGEPIRLVRRCATANSRLHGTSPVLSFHDIIDYNPLHLALLWCTLWLKELRGFHRCARNLGN